MARVAQGTSSELLLSRGNSGIGAFGGGGAAPIVTIEALASTQVAAIVLSQLCRVHLTLDVATFLLVLDPPPAGLYIFTLRVIQDATGGRLMTWPAGADLTPTLEVDPGGYDEFEISTEDEGVTWHVVNTVSVPGTPPAGPVVVDNFNRSNGLISAAAATNGQTWVLSPSDAFSVTASTKAVAKASANSVRAFIAAGLTGDRRVEGTLTPSAGGCNQSLGFAAVDVNNFINVTIGRATNGFSNAYMYKFEAGVESAALYNFNISTSLLTTSPQQIKLELIGDVLTLFIEGVSRGTYTLSAGEMTAFGTAGGIALRAYTAAGNDDGATSWDNLTVTDLE